MPVDGRSPGSRQRKKQRERTLGNLTSPEDNVQKLQTALHAKAKAEPTFRFYRLYDKVYRQDVLVLAYQRCKSNGGVAGVNGQRFEDIEAYGKERWLGELAERLRKKDYKPEPVKRVWIPKPNSKKRPLGIPTITDRVVQTALMMVIEPIFEADLQPEQYAYRRDRGAHDAIKATHSLINTGYATVIEADLADYFGKIPHAELLLCLAPYCRSARPASDKDVADGGGRRRRRKGQP
jgi:retron-type reverse transcriptase